MKKYGLYIIILLMLFIKTSNAACDYETQVKIAREAAGISPNYEVIMFGTGEYEESEVPNEDGSPNYYEITETRIEVNIYNITENLYITVKNKKTNEVKKYEYKDSIDGTITWQNKKYDEIIEYEIKVFSNKEECLGTELRTLSLITPKYNYHSSMPYCYQVDTYYCDEWITQEINMSEDEVYERGFAQQPKDLGNSEETKEKSFWEEYKMVIIACLSILIVGGGIFILIRKKQRSEVV